jgi:hypothetical protein
MVFDERNLVWFCSLKCEPNCKKRARIAWGYWFKKTLYYQVALLYMLARLITNVSQVGTCSLTELDSRLLLKNMLYVIDRFLKITKSFYFSITLNNLNCTLFLLLLISVSHRVLRHQRSENERILESHGKFLQFSQIQSEYAPTLAVVCSLHTF